MVMAAVIKYEKMPILRNSSLRKWKGTASKNPIKRVRRKHNSNGTPASKTIPLYAIAYASTAGGK